MNLSRFRSNRRDCRICRFGVMLVVCSLLINMVAVPKAKAVVIDATAAFGAAAATAAINGTTATTLFTGMSTSAATNGIILCMDAYATATGAAASGTALASTIGAGTIVTAAGAIVLTAAAGYAVYKFIEWLREDKGIVEGGNSVSSTVYPDYFLNTSFPLYRYGTLDVSEMPYIYFDVGDSYSVTLPDGSLFSFSRTSFGATLSIGDSSVTNSKGNGYYFMQVEYNESFKSQILSIGSLRVSDGVVEDRWAYALSPFLHYYDLTSDTLESTVSFQPKTEFSSIPETIPDTDAVVITGIEGLPQNDPQATADAIFQAAIDGALDPVVTVEADPTVTPDPDPDPDGSTEVEPDPDAPDLPSNLGDLGEALTTRFPFSIPWDIYKAVKLLAAPAQAPYWEVDLMEPIKYRFEDIGDTTITLDFGKPEFEIIGITTRWTSTIGFCLALAAATKRFIWTA